MRQCKPQRLFQQSARFLLPFFQFLPYLEAQSGMRETVVLRPLLVMLHYQAVRQEKLVQVQRSLNMGFFILDIPKGGMADVDGTFQTAPGIADALQSLRREQRELQGAGLHFCFFHKSMIDI